MVFINIAGQLHWENIFKFKQDFKMSRYRKVLQWELKSSKKIWGIIYRLDKRDLR